MCLSQLGFGIVTAVSQVTAVVQVQSLACELPHATGTAKKEKEKGTLRGSGEVPEDLSEGIYLL